MALTPYARPWWLALREEATLQPELPNPWTFLPLALLVAFSAIIAVSRALAKMPPARVAVMVLYLGTSVALIGHILSPTVAPTPNPAVAYRETAKALESLESFLSEKWQSTGRYPIDDKPLTRALADRTSPWRSHGRQLPFRIVTEARYGPRLESRPGDMPGTIYYSVQDDGQRYWLTALVLVGAPTGRLAFLHDGEDQPLVITRGAVQGHN